MFFYWFCYILIFIPLRLFYPTKVIGRENLPKKKKGILACNHRSNLDPIIVNNNLYCRPYIPAKHTLFENKVLGAILRSYGAIPMNREAIGLSAIKTVLKILKDEKWLLIFPEGTRKDVSDQEDLSIKGGTAMFSLKSGAPIIPMWLVKKPRFFRRNVLLIGKPFNLDEFKQERITTEVLHKASQKVSKEMETLRDNYLQQQEAKKMAKKTKKHTNKN